MDKNTKAEIDYRLMERQTYWLKDMNKERIYQLTKQFLISHHINAFLQITETQGCQRESTVDDIILCLH